MLRLLALVAALVAIAFGVTLSLLPFTTDVTIARTPPIETSSECDGALIEAFRGGADGASLVDEPGAEIVLSDGYGCRQPARRRLGVTVGAIVAGLTLFALAARRGGEPDRPAPAHARTRDKKPASPPPGDVTETVRRHYEDTREEDRLAKGLNELELVRTRQILGRHLPPPPATVLDVGGGTGIHAAWLAEDGYRVHVVDLTPRHVEAVERTLGARGVTAAVGDARRLDAGDGSYDVVLLLGPLYHLLERSERLDALREARRVVRPGGLVAVAGISRFASLFDGLARGFLFDPVFREIVGNDLRDGRHYNDGEHTNWFTTAFFHHPDELGAEIEDAGLVLEELVGVEGMAGWMAHLEEAWATPAGRQVIVEAAQGIEAEPALLGLSAHLLAIARRTPGRPSRRAPLR